ncbi:MAG: serine hydrolase domain-containing protein [Pseudomonadota bacterium]
MADGYVHPGFRKVAETFLSQLPRHTPGGAALCIYHRGEQVVDIWGGTRNKAGEPWTADTLSLSFSTTKGIVATLLHILACRHEIDYDTPVSHYWPAFAANGKGRITVRQLLCHEAGLYSIRRLIRDAGEMRDWPHMLQLIERAEPVHAPGSGNGYHALTFGWLVGGLVEKVAGQPLAQVLREEVTQPLNLGGCFIGVPDRELGRCADLIVPERKPRPEGAPRRPRKPPLAQQVVTTALRLSGFDPDSVEEAMVPPGMGRFDWNTRETRQACIPGAGGMFDARSLARLYALLGNDGELDGVRLLEPGAVRRFATVQSRERGAVIPLPMHWRLGYHRVFTLGPRTPRAFGHFGYGGSGAWCDPSRGLAVGYVVNSGVGTPFGDTRLWKINTAAIRAVDSLPSLLWQWLRA